MENHHRSPLAEPAALALARRIVARSGAYDAALRLRLALERPLPFGQYRAELRFYRRFIRAGDLCFDIGANLGQKTSLFLDAGARVVAVEPQPDCVEILRRGVARRGDVEIVPVALAAADGQAELFLCDETSTLSSMSKRFISTMRFAPFFSWRRTIAVPTTTLDRLIDQYGLPAYCKIDVEGYEASVLEGLTRPVPMVSFEFSREFADEARKCTRRLRTIGPFKFDFVPNKATEWLVGDWIDDETLFGRLESLADPLLVGEIYARLGA